MRTFYYHRHINLERSTNANDALLIITTTVDRAVRIDLLLLEYSVELLIKYWRTRLIPEVTINYRWSKTDGYLVSH